MSVDFAARRAQLGHAEAWQAFCFWFLLQPPSDLHGIGHTARVMVWAAVLTRGTPWFEPAVWAAACHDLRRKDDGTDPEHGFRAGAWVRKVLPGKLRKPLQDLELIAQACDWHVCPDRHSGWDHEVLWYLKDADGLDRVRLTTWTPPTYASLRRENGSSRLSSFSTRPRMQVTWRPSGSRQLTWDYWLAS